MKTWNVPIKRRPRGSPHKAPEAALPTLRRALDAGAAVMVLSHLGRPKEGVFEVTAESLARSLPGWGAGRRYPAARLPRRRGGRAGELVLLENRRMNVGEGGDDAALAAKYAALCVTCS